MEVNDKLIDQASSKEGNKKAALITECCIVSFEVIWEVFISKNLQVPLDKVF